MGIDTRELTLGYSPCPNDTFTFHALVTGKVAGRFSFAPAISDVEALNQMAVNAALDVTKVSCHCLGRIRGKYSLLRSGAALGRGCGPLIVARRRLKPSELKGLRIAIPGRLTTAFLLMQLMDPSLRDVVVMTFDEIMDAVSTGLVDAGLVIHEGRFTFARYGLSQVIDLGQWWEETTGLPIPLGCIVARRELGPQTALEVQDLIRQSVLYARANPGESAAYVRQHAQELDGSVIARHIGLYVNDFTVDMGEEGVAAVGEFLGRAEAAGLIGKTGDPLFAE